MFNSSLSRYFYPHGNEPSQMTHNYKLNHGFELLRLSLVSSITELELSYLHIAIHLQLRYESISLLLESAPLN